MDASSQQISEEFLNWCFSFTNILEAVGRDGDGFQANLIHFAAEKGHFKICKLIIDKNGLENPANDNGWTPLHIAAKYGHFEICKLILQNIDDKSPRDISGRTPLDYAKEYGHKEICNLIKASLKST